MAKQYNNRTRTPRQTSAALARTTRADSSVAGSGGASSAIVKLQTLADAARGYASQARAKRTRESYAERWAIFEAWCAAHGLPSLPCAPATLAMYLTDRANQGIRPATLQGAMSAIAWHHSAAGIARADMPHRNPQVAEIWRGIRRSKGVAPRRVAPVVVDELHAMVEQLPDSMTGVRDRALLVVGFAGAFRRSELVELRVEDVSFRRDGLHVIVRKSKTDQEGQGAEVGLPYGSVEATCPVRALQAWLEASAISAGPIFRALNRHGQLRGPMAAADVARIVKRSAAGAGLDPALYSGHSLRAGLATSAARAGKADRDIMRQGRWAGRAMVDRYVRGAKLLDKDNAAAGIGL